MKRLADVYFGASIEEGGVITGIANTPKVRRVFGTPLTDQDLDKAFEAARAYCAGQGDVFLTAVRMTLRVCRGSFKASGKLKLNAGLEWAWCTNKDEECEPDHDLVLRPCGLHPAS